jgi:hypothetical protein
MGQAYIFHQVRQRFVRVETQHEGRLEMVQVALLLTLWSPYDSSSQVNTFWLDKALHHASKAKLQWSKRPEHRTLWWCCVVRNRTMALGLRRPHKLTVLSTPLMPILSDFEHLIDSSQEKVGKRQICMARAFICMCKLAGIVKSIAIINNPNLSWNSWKNIEVAGSASTTFMRLSIVDGWLDALEEEVDSVRRQALTDNPTSPFEAALHTIRIMIQ